MVSSNWSDYWYFCDSVCIQSLETKWIKFIHNFYLDNINNCGLSIFVFIYNSFSLWLIERERRLCYVDHPTYNYSLHNWLYRIHQETAHALVENMPLSRHVATVDRIEVVSRAMVLMTANRRLS